MLLSCYLLLWLRFDLNILILFLDLGYNTFSLRRWTISFDLIFISTFSILILTNEILWNLVTLNSDKLERFCCYYLLCYILYWYLTIVNIATVFNLLLLFFIKGMLDRRLLSLTYRYWLVFIGFFQNLLSILNCVAITFFFHKKKVESTLIGSLFLGTLKWSYSLRYIFYIWRFKYLWTSFFVSLLAFVLPFMHRICE